MYEQESQEREIRPIRMEYMYPNQEFCSKRRSGGYANCTGAWVDGRRSWTIEDARRIMRSKSPFSAFRPFLNRPETFGGGSQITELVQEQTMMAKSRVSEVPRSL